MPLSPAIAIWLQSQGYDAVHASKIGLSCSTDDVIMMRAIVEQRVIITADLDYPRLLALSHAKEPGLILFRGGDYNENEVIERLTKVFETIPNGELLSSIVVIEKRRIRRRRLPLE